MDRTGGKKLSASALRADAFLLGAFLSSGLAAVGLELVWTRILGLAFGSEPFGVLAVLAGFFFGLAIGSAAWHRVILRSRRPALIYIAMEGIVAAYGLIGPIILLRLAEALPSWLGGAIRDNGSGRALFLNLAIATVLLLPATIPMGAATVAMIEAWRRKRTRAANDNTVAWLYTVNTFGATLGIAVAIYWLLPAFGMRAASAVLGGFSLLAVLLAFLWMRTNPTSAPEPETADDSPDPARSRGMYALLFFTGLAGIGIETVGTQVLAQIFEDTVHTFANILAVYLFGTALGAWLYATRLAARFRGARDRGTALLLYGLTLAAIFSGFILGHAADLASAFAPPGSSYFQHSIAETMVAALALIPPTVFMGATFSHLLGYFTYRGAGYGSAFNTLGASLAPFGFGLALIPAAGYGVAFYTAAGIYLALFLAATLPRKLSAARIAVGAGLAILCGGLAYSPLVLVQFPPRTKLLEQRLGLQGVVSVTEHAAGNGSVTRILQVDQRFLMGGSPGLVTKRMGHLGMLVANSPKRVLYLGVGTGITVGSALDFPVEHVIGVELLPEILKTLHWFEDFNHHLESDPRVELHASDARRFMRASEDRYDLISADLYHASRDGTGSLYTLEHFSNIRAHLNPDGLFAQWLPLYQLRPDDLRTITRTYLAVFPDAHSMIGNFSGEARLALIAWMPGSSQYGVDVPHAEDLLRQSRERVYDGIPDLLGSYMLDSAGLSQYAGPGPINTDDTQRIVFDAAQDAAIETPAEMCRTLASLLPRRTPFPEDFIRVPGADGLAGLRRRVSPYAEAVGHYLNGEVARLESRGNQVSVRALAEYLTAYQTDVRFTLAAGKLLELAVEDPGMAKDVVERLWLIHPDQPEFNRLHQNLQGLNESNQVVGVISRFLQTGGGQ